jgi:predicted RNA-binding protein
MDQNLINAAFTMITSLGAWIVKAIWDAIKELKQENKEVKEQLNERYVRKDDFKEVIGEIKDLNRKALARIFDRIDHKADRTEKK